MVRLSRKFHSSKAVCSKAFSGMAVSGKPVSGNIACFNLSRFLVAVGLGLLAPTTLPNHASAGWPHHARQVVLWHTPISSVGQCYPRPVISHPATFRCNSGFYVRRDACDYRWSYSSNRLCAPRT